VKLVIVGAPRTKKNSLRRMKFGNRLLTMSSESHQEWENSAVGQLIDQTKRCDKVLRKPRKTKPKGKASKRPLPPLVCFGNVVSMRALVYRERDVGDLGNYLAAVCDALEKAGVVENDKLIVSFDGSRPLLDRKNPRVELDIEPFDEQERP